MIFLFVGRNVVRIILMRFRKSGLNLKHIILVGYSRAAEEYIDRIVQNPQWGYKVMGILDDRVVAGTEYRGIGVLGTIGSLSALLEVNHPDEIAITLGLSEYYKLERIVAMCEKAGVHTKFIPDYSKIIPTKPYTEDLLGLAVINIRHVPLSNTFNMMVKRAMDIVGSLICIVLFSPVMLITAVLIKLTSPGPLIFTQGGWDCTMFRSACTEFRSMEVQTQSGKKEGWTVKNDPRVTPVGRFIPQDEY